MDKFRWAYICCGGIACTTAEELLKSDKHEIVAVWNRTRSKAEAFVERFGGRVYDSMEETICAPGVEGVYLAGTPDQHPAHIRACIAHAKPVLCEKPFAVNAEVTQALFEEAAQAGVYVSEAMWTWHNDAALKVREWVRGRLIGDVTDVRFSYGYPLIAASPHHRLRDPERIGGALLDIGIYPVRYCYELFGMPRTIHCTGRLKSSVDFGETVELDYEGFSARLDIAIDRLLGENGEITGTQGRICIDEPHAARKLRLITAERETLRFDELLYAREFSNVAEEIRSGCREGKMIPASGSIDVMRILDECRRQMGLVYPCEA